MSLSEAYVHCLDFGWQACVQSPYFPSKDPSTVLTFAGRRGFRAHFLDKDGSSSVGRFSIRVIPDLCLRDCLGHFQVGSYRDRSLIEGLYTV